MTGRRNYAAGRVYFDANQKKALLQLINTGCGGAWKRVITDKSLATNMDKTSTWTAITKAYSEVNTISNIKWFLEQMMLFIENDKLYIPSPHVINNRYL